MPFAAGFWPIWKPPADKKGEIIYEKTPEKYRFFMIALWALCLFAVLPFGNVRAAAVKPSCTKTKTVYFQKQTFHDPMTRKNIVSYDLLGTGNLPLAISPPKQ